MTRPLRVQFDDATYHVMSRGVEKREIFADDCDRRRWLGLLGETCASREWDVWAYCLMGNHFHLLIQTLAPTLSRGMQELNSRYCQSFNRRHARVGPLLQGRFTALFVEDLAYLYAVARYIVLNPVRSGLCLDPSDWPWSSYGATRDSGPSPSWLRTDRLLAVFDPDPETARRLYAQFVQAGIGRPDPAVTPIDDLLVGGQPLRRLVASRAATPSAEVPRPQRRSLEPIGVFASRHPSRNAAIAAARASGMYTLSEIGSHFGLHYSSVSRIVSTERMMLKRKI